MTAFGAAAQDAAEAPEKAAGSSPSVLEGSWRRPDGGYVLKLGAPGPAGELTAAYFNPNPIHVESAEWSRKDAKLGGFVILQAPNYPGSTYTLTYDAAKDRLKGVYYQALLRQSFEVQFTRQLQ